MKRLISVLLCLMMIAASLPVMISNAEGTENPFTDVKEGKWYTEAVLWCYENGYMAGVSATEFGVNSAVTREMFVTLLAKIDGADLSVYAKDTEGLPFTDIKAGYYIRALKWAYENKYTSGVSATEFGTGKPVSREQLATFLYNYAQKKGRDVSATVDLSTYADGSSVSKYARAAMGWAIASGMISGTGNNMLSPKQDATRAQIALIVKNFVENVLSARHLTITAEGTTARITDAGDLAFMMYAKGDAYTDDEFKAAYLAECGEPEDDDPKNYIGPADLDENGAISVEGLYGSYTFHVTYVTGESENISVYFDPATEYPVGSVKLGDADISEYTIVYGAAKDVEDISVSDLASELSERIRDICGAELPVYADNEREPVEGAKEILIGKTDREEAGLVTVDRSALIYDTLHIEIQGDHLILTGNEKCGGTHIAVFEFLRRLGCTYYTDDLCLTEPAERIELPDGWTVHIRPSFDLHCNYQRSGWSPRIGLTNETGLRFNNVVHTLPEFAAEDYEDTWDCHLKYYMAPDPCLTKTEVIDRIITNVKTKLSHVVAKGTEEPIIWLCMSDGSVRGCQCATCRKMYHTFGVHSTYSYILKYVGDAIADEYPTAKVVGIAYKYTITAPRTDVTDEEYAAFLSDWTEAYVPPQKLEAPSTAVMCICTDNSCASHPIDDPDCHPKVNGNVEFNENFERYCDIFENIYVWAYYTGDYCRYTVFPNIGEMWEMLNYFYRHGVSGLYGFGRTSRYGDFSELHTYIDAQMSLDVTISKEQFFLKVNKFLEAMYGPGWKEMRAYMELTDRLSSKNHWNNFSQGKWELIITEQDWRDNLDEMDAIFDRALAAAENETQTFNIKTVYTTVLCTKVRLAYIDYKNSGSDEDFERFKAVNNEWRDLCAECRLHIPNNWTETLDPARWEFD